MRKDQVDQAVRDLAKEYRLTDWIVVGSQAIHGEHPDPPASAVITSADVDLTNDKPEEYQEWMTFHVMAHFGMNSEYQSKRGYYIEVVRPTLPRLPTVGEIVPFSKPPAR